MDVQVSNTANFSKDVLSSEKPVLVDFWAPWCGPCRALTPVLEEIADEYEDKVRVVKVNVDENPHLAMQYNIRSIPALKVFVGGEIVESLVGAMPKVELEMQLTKYLR